MKEIAATLLKNVWQALRYLNSTQEVLLDHKGVKEEKPEQKTGGSKIKRVIACCQMCVRRTTPEEDGGVPHQSLPYAPIEMDPAGHFIFLFLISSFERC